jgi:hypothetical protein
MTDRLLPRYVADLGRGMPATKRREAHSTCPTEILEFPSISNNTNSHRSLHASETSLSFCCRQIHHKSVLTNSRSHARVVTEIQLMIRKPHTDCFPTPATFTWQGAGEGTFM